MHLLDKITLTKGTITDENVDAIVNSANNQLRQGAGVDGAIHKAAGIKLQQECASIGFCKTGKAVITRGYNLPARHVIHAVGPTIEQENSDALLYEAYQSALSIAQKHRFKKIAFSAISAGFGGGFPPHKAADIAISAIYDFLVNNKTELEEIKIVLFTERSRFVFENSKSLLAQKIKTTSIHT